MAVISWLSLISFFVICDIHSNNMWLSLSLQENTDTYFISPMP